MPTKRVVFITLLFSLAILLVSCNLPGKPSQPTIAPGVIYTAAAKTVAAQQTAAYQGTPIILPSATSPVGYEPTSTTQPPVNTPEPTAAPTNTAFPTATATHQPPAPTATKTSPSRVTSQAASLSKAPTIDGTWEEWTTTQFPLKNVVYGASKWSGEDDLQASYRIGWDKDNLYVAVKVYDDTYVQNTTKENLYKGDSIELLLSTKPNQDSTSQGLQSFDYQIGISPGNPTIGDHMEAYLWYPQSKAGSLSDVEIGAVPMKGGYRIEFAIPWSVFGVTPEKGQVFGFALSVSDNDNKSENVQQTIISSAPHRYLPDPTTWGLLELK